MKKQFKIAETYCSRLLLFNIFQHDYKPAEQSFVVLEISIISIIYNAAQYRMCIVKIAQILSVIEPFIAKKYINKKIFNLNHIL